ncbi:MAG: HEAT repeat domain-containing protein [Myxococcales bacterium]|nr:HEAT repeat domain-containing protein [Myxococcales bacterium]
MPRRICALALITLVSASSASCVHRPAVAPAPAPRVREQKHSVRPRALARRHKVEKAWTCARVKQARAAAFAEAARRLAATRVRSVYSIDQKTIARARAAGLDAKTIERLLAGAFAQRLHPRACPRKKPKVKLGFVAQIFAKRRFADAKQTETANMLLALLAKVGSKRSLSLLFRLSELGYWNADSAREAILERAMKRAITRSPCRAPSAAEVAAARTALAGFVVLERAGSRSDKLVARAANARELDDLAYLMAASSARGPAVGTWPERGRGNWMRRAKRPSATRREWAKKIAAAKARGDIAEVVFAARRYLESLGYPKGIRTDKVHDYSWGGARYSYVMRDLALAAEANGDLVDAAFAYRRANPGGGACGSSYWSNWTDQVKGVIRAEERRGRCRAVVLERLLSVDGSGRTYGPARLAAAGFDVARLYRGALVARDRDLGAATLRGALARSPHALAQAANARLKQHGNEAFEKRVYAVEGLADTVGAAALPTLVALTRSGSTALRARALRAIAKLAERPRYDPCVPSMFGFGLSGSSAWRRSIRALSRSCKTHLKPRPRARLAAKLHPLLRDPSVDVRRATIETLGQLAARRSIAALRRVAKRDRYASTAHCAQADIDRKRCKARYPLRSEAQQAADKIETLLRARAADAKKGRHGNVHWTTVK